MHCFNHHDREAVGSCKACAKGLCPECLVDLETGLSCKGPHEEIVKSYAAILSFNSRTIAGAPKNFYLPAIFTAVMGSLFMWYGYSQYNGIQNILFAMGAVFFIYACVLFVRTRAIYSGNRA